MTWLHPKAGCSSWIENNLVVIKRIQYSIIFIIAAIVLVNECYKCLEKFFKRETGTADTYLETPTVGTKLGFNSS